MSIKRLDLDAVPERQKHLIIGSFLTVWLLGTIYFQDIVQMM